MNDLIADFRGIARFNGREPRRRFWPYLAVVVFIYVVVGQVVMIPIMSGMMAKMVVAMSDPQFTNAVESDNPFQVQAAMFKMMPDMSQMAMVGAGLSLLLVVLMAAAASRRLHDSGLSAYWALLPVPFKLISLATMPAVFSGFRTTGFPDVHLFGLLMLNGTLSLGALVTLIVLLCRPSTPGENRFGEAP